MSTLLCTSDGATRLRPLLGGRLWWTPMERYTWQHPLHVAPARPEAHASPPPPTAHRAHNRGDVIKLVSAESIADMVRAAAVRRALTRVIVISDDPGEAIAFAHALPREFHVSTLVQAEAPFGALRMAARGDDRGTGGTGTGTGERDLDPSLDREGGGGGSEGSMWAGRLRVHSTEQGVERGAWVWAGGAHRTFISPGPLS
jgi:hypothetical protein